MEKLKKISKYLVPIFTFLLVIIMFNKTATVITGDSCWHIKVGEWIFKNKSIPAKDMLSMHNDLNFMAHEWLFDVITYLITTKLGISIAIGLMIILLTTGYSYLLYKSKSPYLGLALLFLFVISGITKPISLIPDTFISILIVISGKNLYEDYENKKSFYKSLIINGLITLIVCNFNGGMLSILLVQSIYLLSIKTIINIKENKKHIIQCLFLFIETLVVSLFNPYGLYIYKYSIQMMKSSAAESILDYVPFSFTNSGVVGILLFIGIFILYGYGLFIKKERTSVLSVAVITFYTAMLFRYSRCINLFLMSFVIFMIPYIKIGITQIEEQLGNRLQIKKLIKKTHILVKFSLIVLLIFVGLIGTIRTDIPSNIDAYIEKKYISAQMKQCIDDDNVFSLFDYGGYLIYSDKNSFIDGRIDCYIPEFNNPNLYDLYQKSLCSVEILNNISTVYDIDYVLLKRGTMYEQLLITSKDWTFIAKTKNTILFRKETSE